MSKITNEGLRERELRHASGVYPTKPVAMLRGKGAHLWDAQGKDYIDCSAGHGVANLGHAHPEWVRAVCAQAGTLSTLAGSFPNDRRAEFQECLVQFLPGGFERLFLCNSGTEAVEGALKFARLTSGRTGIVAAERGFHGRTMGALACTWESKYRAPFEPLIGDVQHAAFGRLDAFEACVGERTACVIVEVVQGEGGVRLAPPEFFAGLRQLCDERGALLIFDEVQTGFGRTGRRFACEHNGVLPDILALGKGIGGGLAMGAVACGPKLGELPPGSHGSTFGGNPLACAAGLASLRILEEEGLVERSRAEGAWFRESLAAIDSPEVVEVRGLGLMVAMELRCPVAPILAELQTRGVIALAAGPQVLRFLPPLVIQREDLERVVQDVANVLAR